MSAIAAFFANQPVHTALVVGGLTAIVAGVVGVFTVTRGQSFAGHALADLGAVGGAGAFLIGMSQVLGFVLAGIVAALVIEGIGVNRMRGRDVPTGVVFGLGLGLAALFLYLDATTGKGGNAAISVLFGSLFAIDPGVVWIVAVLGFVALTLIALSYRWLLTESLGSALATARKIPVRLSGFVFIIALALAVELSSFSIGAVLSTALLVGPAAMALHLTRRFGIAVVLAAVLGLAAVWAGCAISYASYYWDGRRSNWPVSFCVVAVIFAGYVSVRGVVFWREGRSGRAGQARGVRGDFDAHSHDAFHEHAGVIPHV